MYSFALNYHWNELDVRGFHIFNLIIHILTSFIVFLFIKKILSLSHLKSESYKIINFTALFVAIIFSIHPIQTQAVTYIVQRMTSMSGLFYILSVYLYTLARQQQIKDKFSVKILLFYFFSLFSFILSIMSKQIAVTIPLALLLIEICFLRNKEGKASKKYIYIFLTILIVAFSILAVTGNLPRETDKITRLDYLITQFRVMVKYVQLLILPINQNLDHDVDYSTAFWRFQEVASFLFICLLIFISLFYYKKNKLITFGIAWFFITQALESTIFPISGLMYEHRLYLATMGYSLILVTIIYHFLKNRRKFMFLLLILIAVSYGFATFQRNKVWKTKYTLWSDVVKKSPNKARPNYNMGNVWTDAGKHKIAIKYYMKALEIKPDYVQAYNNLGSAWNYLGDIDKAIQMYEKALSVDPNHLQALQNLGVLYYRKNDLDTAKNYYERYKELNPQNVKVYNDLGIIFARQKKYNKAVQNYTKALEIDPNFTNPMMNLGIMYSTLGKLDEAKEMYERVLSYEPNNAKVWNDLGIVWARKGEFEKAINCYKKALVLKPDFENATKNLKISEQYFKQKNQ